MRTAAALLLACVASAVDAPPLCTGASPVRVWVDQIGWRTHARKLAIVASDAPLPEDLALSVCAADTLKPAWTLADHRDALAVKADGGVDGESGDRVAQLDFSALTAPGRYVIVIERGGARERSCAFRIADDVFAGVAAAMWKAFWYERADVGKDERHGGAWHHAPDHRGKDQATAARVYRWAGGPWPERVGTEIVDPTPRDVSGGWWDAGDFNKYMGNTVACIDDLLLAAAIGGDAYRDQQVDIPESGNGVPDAFDEIRCGVELVLKMADADGAAFGRVHEDPTSPPEADANPVQLTCATSGATMNRCAALAHAALAWRERKLDPVFAKRCQDEAVKAWRLLIAKPHPWPVDAKDPTKQADTGAWFSADWNATRALAAICLWRLTDDAAYETEARRSLAGLTAIAPGEQTEWYPVIRAYVTAGKADRFEAARLKALVLAAADAAVAASGPARPYAASIRGYWWGSNRLVAQNGVVCLLASQFCEDAAKRAAYVAGAEEYAHYLLGRNAIGLCFVSNLGALGAERSVDVMFHSWVGNIGAGEAGAQYIGHGPGKIGPFPGMLVGGVSGGMKRYVDDLDWHHAPWEFNEPDITYQSPAVCLIGWLGFAAPRASTATPASSAPTPPPAKR